MNPAWCNPPPPGTDVDGDDRPRSTALPRAGYAHSLIDQIDPYIKNPEYIKYKRSRRTRSRSPDRHRSESSSRDRRRRHRSRSRSRGRRRRSHTRSKSHSSSPSRHRHRHKRRRSRSKSHERRRRDRRRNEEDECAEERPNTQLQVKAEREDPDPDVADDAEDDDDDDDGDDDDVETKENAFKNDGSFMEMFKKMQAEVASKQQEPAASSGGDVVRKPLPMVGKRRGGRVLKTGLVEKTKVVEDDELANATDPWSIYLKEVKRYKEACCDDDSKTRPLVK